MRFLFGVLHAKESGFLALLASAIRFLSVCGSDSLTAETRIAKV